MEIDPERTFAELQALPLAQQVDFVFQTTKALHEFARKSLCPFITTTFVRPNSDDLEAAILLLLGRVVAWTDSLMVLSDGSHSQAVVAGQRAIFELLIDLRVLLADASLVKRFHAFTFIERFYAAESFVDFVDKHGIDQQRARIERDHVTDPANIAKYQSLRLQYWNKTKKTDRVMHWSRHVGMKDRVSSLGGQYARRYHENYARMCWLIHGSAVGTSGLPKEAFHHWFAWSHLDIQESLAEFFNESAKALKLFDADPTLREKLADAQNATALAIIEWHKSKIG